MIGLVLVLSGWHRVGCALDGPYRRYRVPIEGGWRDGVSDGMHERRRNGGGEE